MGASSDEQGIWITRLWTSYSSKSFVVNVLTILLVVIIFCASVVAYPTTGQFPVLSSTVWLVLQFWFVGLLIFVCRGRVGTWAGKVVGLLRGEATSQRRPCRIKTTHTGKGTWFSFASSEMQGWRNAMEDAVVTIPALAEPLDEFAIFAVFDGHGGKDASAHAAGILTDRVSRRLAHDSEVGVALRQSLLDIEDDLRKHNSPASGIPLEFAPAQIPGKDKCHFDLMGCTATVAVLSRTSVTVCNVGDSRIFKCRNGECVPLTRDHKPESPRERRRIEAAGGMVIKFGPCYRVDCNLNLSRALADFKYKDPNLAPEDQKISPVGDVVTAEIDHQDEFLLVACDGLFELMTWNTVCDYVHKRIKTMPLTAIVEGLLDECCSSDMFATGGRGTDNESVIIVKLHDS